MISHRLGESLVSIKAPKDFRIEIGEEVGTNIPAAMCHLFDAETGERIPQETA